ASLAKDLDTDYGFSFAYGGTTQGTTWTGDFSGNILGLDVTGFINGSISASAPSDPDFKIDSGNLFVGGTPYTLGGTFSFDENTGSGTLHFELMRAGAMVTWDNMGALKVVANPDGSWTLSGSITWKQGGFNPITYSISIDYAPGNPFVVPPTPETFNSTLT